MLVYADEQADTATCGSNGMPDTMPHTHGNTKFVGPSSAPAHMDEVGIIGMDKNPMVGTALAVEKTGKQESFFI